MNANTARRIENIVLTIQVPFRAARKKNGKAVDMSHNSYRPDRDGSHRRQFDQNATQTTCGICGKPVDFNLRYPNPLSPCIDHIIPIAKGGHPSDIDNLQLAHWTCNRQKSDRLFREATPQIESNQNLPQSMDWSRYRAGKK